VERRRGGETGLASIQALEGAEAWRWTDGNPWAGQLLDRALARCEDRKPGSPRDNVKQPILFLLDYRDGLRGAVYMLDGHIKNACFASGDLATEIWLQEGRPFSHFSALVHYIEQMLVTGRQVYPVERTLLTTGALAALMDSSYQHGKRIDTPWLNVVYRAPRDSFFARGPVPALEPAS
jgi:hypothetical protein